MMTSGLASLGLDERTKGAWQVALGTFLFFNFLWIVVDLGLASWDMLTAMARAGQGDDRGA